MNPYDVLKINKYSTSEEVKNAYNRLMKEYHPDSGNGDIEKLNEVKKAYIQIKENKNNSITLNISVPISQRELALSLGQKITVTYQDILFEVKVPYETRVGDIVTIRDILPETTLKIKFKERNGKSE